MVMCAVSGFQHSGSPSRHMTRVFSDESNNNQLIEIEFKIYPDGSYTEEVKGVKGPDCIKLTEDLNKRMGKVVSQVKTDEYYETPETLPVSDEATVYENNSYETKYSEW